MKRALVAALAVMLLLAPVVPFAAVGTAAAAAPAGMATIPDGNVAEDVPSGESLALSASELEGGVLASDHADSLEVVLTTADHAPTVMDSDSAVVSGDGMALVLRDDTESAGREVAIDAGQLQEALGYKPQAIRGTHEDGSTWTASAEYVDGYLVFDVPHFSSNTVTFSGEVKIDASGATNGTQFTYSLGAVDSVTDPNVTLTGKTNTETETITRSVSGSDTINAEIAGTEPADVNVTLEGSPGKGILYADGQQTLKIRRASGVSETVTTANDDISIIGEADFDADGGKEIAYQQGDEDYYIYHPDTDSRDYIFSSADYQGSDTPPGVNFPDIDGDGYPEFVFEGHDLGILYHGDATGDVQNLGPNYNYAKSHTQFMDVDDDDEWEVAFQESTSLTIVDENGNVEQDQIGPDGLATYDVIGSVDLDQDGTHENVIISDSQGEHFLYHDGGVTYQDDTPTGGESPAVDYDDDGIPERVSSNDQILEYSQNGISIQPTLYGYSQSDFYRAQFGTIATFPTGTENPAVDVDGDGADEISHSGVLSGSKSYDLGTLDTTDDSWDVSVTGGVDLTAQITERTTTSDPAIEINGETLSHTGRLDNGETTTLSGSGSWLRQGTNRVNASVGSGGLSTDAPEPQVGVDYRHKATDSISVNYTSSTFEENYNISHTYADATENAQATIPFASGRIVDISNAEYRVNNGPWTAVDPADYRLDGTILDVYLDDATGGVQAGETLDVRATGRKISVDGGEVTVTDPTKPGEELDTQLQIDSRSEDFHVNVGPTDDGDRVHYAYADDFPTEDYVVIEANGDQQLYLPNAVTGDQFRVSHLDTRVVAEQGDVRIDVIEAGQDPELDVSPGPGGSGDPVTVEYYNTESGVTYLLNSLTRSIVVDSDTAQSPAIFEDDDSEDTWAILRDSAPTGSSSDGADVGLGQFRERASGAVGSISLPIDGSGLGQLALVGVLGLGGVLVLRRVWPFGSDDSEAVTRDTSTASGSGSGRLSGLATRASGLAGSLGSVGGRAARASSRGLLTGLQGLLGYLGNVVSIILGNRRASIAAAVVAAIVAARVGLVQLPEGTGILIVVSGVPLATWLIMRRSDAVSRRVWLASTIAAVILGLEFVAPGTVQTAIEQLTSEQVAPLLILVGAGGLYLWYRARQSDRPQIIIGGNNE